MKTSYCVNALCSDRKNDDTVTECQSCSSSLLVNGRFRLIRKINPETHDKRIKVYEAIDIESDETVIIKIDEMVTKNSTNFIKKEHEILGYLPENLFPRITPNDYFEWHPVPDITGLVIAGLVLPKIEGQNSKDWIAEYGPISQDKAINWLNQILPYLKLLSKIGYLHRDIKPSNIMVSHEKLTLIDYATCREIDEDYLSIIAARIKNSKTQWYREVTRVFSSGYTAPEQNEGKALPQSDFFSLGRTLVYWVSGINPSDLIPLAQTTISWSTTDSVKHLDKSFTNFIDRLTHVDPRKRPLTIHDLSTELNQELPAKLKKEQRKKSIPAKIRKAVGLGLGILGLFIAGIYIITRGLNSAGTQALADGEPEEAARHFRRALNLDPKYSDAIHNLGVACQKVKDYKCASSSLQKAIALNPKDSYSTYQLGVLREEKSDIIEASKLYKKAIALDPNNGEALNRSARLKILENKYEEAESMLAEASNLNPDKQLKAEILRNQGWIDYRKNQYTKSIQKLSKSIELDPRFSDSFCLLAKNYEARRDFNIAKGYWSACLELPEFRTEVYGWRKEILDRAFSDE